MSATYSPVPNKNITEIGQNMKVITNDKILKLNILIDEIRKETGVPFLDVAAYKEYQSLYRYQSGGASGKEILYMFSCGKPITVTGAMRLVEKRLLGLDDKVCDYLPAVKNAFVIDENGNKVTVGENMTVRHLFTMSAGFPFGYSEEPVIKLAKENRNADLQDFICKFVETPLLFEPGKQFKYGLCHDVLGAVIEKVAGKTFAKYMEEEIFIPLNMNNSNFYNDEGGTEILYMAREDDSIFEVSGTRLRVPTKKYQSGGGGLISTVDDYLKFATALASEGKAYNGYRVLGVDALKELTTPQMEKVTVNNNFTCVQGEDYGYGLGVRVRNKDTAWGLRKGEFGWDGAAGSYVLIDPVNKATVFIGMHVRSWPYVFMEKHLKIVKGIYETFFTT